MQTKDAIRFALMLSDGAVMGEIDGMKDAAMTFPTPRGGCHPLWVLGHLTVVEGSLRTVLYGEENPAGDWARYFADGVEPVKDASAYPEFSEIRAKYAELRGQNLKVLEALSDEELDAPAKMPPKGREREFANFGQSFLTIAMHQVLHRSHVTDARRALGR